MILLSDNTSDFCGHRRSDELHPRLRKNAEAVRAGGLTFYTSVQSLLTDLRADIQPPTDQQILRFLYEDAAVETVKELQENSRCEPTFVGPVHCDLFTTENDNVVETRLSVSDTWESKDRRRRLPFSYSGRCLYRLSDGELFEPRNDTLGLTETLPNGSERSVKGSCVNLRMGTIYVGSPAPLEAQPVHLETATGANPNSEPNDTT